jgi:hypothetical protein
MGYSTQALQLVVNGRRWKMVKTQYKKSAIFTLTALLLIMLPAMRPAEKYLGSWLWWFPYAAICFLLLSSIALRQQGYLAQVLSSKWFIFGTPLIMAIVSTAFYPLADGLKVDMQGQDQDDCTILGVNAILSGENPHAKPSYFGNPCSPLLGAIIPFIPFALSNLMGLAGPVFFTLSVALLYLQKVNRLQLGTFVALIAGTPASLELMVNGSDFVFIGFISLVAVFMVKKSENKMLSNPELLTLSVIVGLLSSARISSLIFAVSFGLILLFRSNRWILFTALVTIVSVLPNLAIYLSSPGEYSPLHLVAKGQSLVPGGFYVLMFAVTLAALVLGAYGLKNRVLDELSLTLLVISPHLIFLAFGDLIFNRNFDIFWWEGANYLYLLTPMLSWFVATRLTSQKAA